MANNLVVPQFMITTISLKAISRQNACDFVGGVGSLVNPGLGKAINGASGLIGCK